MGSLLTPLRKIPYPAETDVPDVAADLNALANNIDNRPIVGQGVLASRPASAVAGNRYYVSGDGTTANNGIEWLDTGSGWIATAVAPTSGTLALRPAAGNFGRLYEATDIKRWFLDDGTNWVPLLPGLATRGISASATAVAGDLIVVTSGNPLTVTLPAPSLGARVGVIVLAASGASPVTVAGTSIYGVGLSAASSFPLGTVGAHVELQSDGTSWYIVEGQQNSGWVALALATNIGAGSGYTPSVRLIGDRVWLKGAPQNNTGGAIAPGASLATVPAGLRPGVTVTVPMVPSSGSGLFAVTITVAGAMTLSGNNVSNGTSMDLDGQGYSLS